MLLLALLVAAADTFVSHMVPDPTPAKMLGFLIVAETIARTMRSAADARRSDDEDVFGGLLVG